MKWFYRWRLRKLQQAYKRNTEMHDEWIAALKLAIHQERVSIAVKIDRIKRKLPEELKG